MDDEFETGVRDLHEKVGRLDELLNQRTIVTDLADRRADAAHAVAEEATKKIRRVIVACALVAFLWTPLTAYGAVWMHERVRNHCYPGVTYQAETPPADEPWYCGAFPGTGRHDNHGGP